MKRRSVLTVLSLGAIGMSGLAPVNHALANLARRDERMPALFVGHGSPYALVVKGENEPIAYFNEATTMGSISMRSLLIG